jgi:hypothetical protein
VKRNAFRRVERWVVGLAMAVIAVVLERVVMRAVKERGEALPAADPTTLTSRGGEVDLDPEPRS